MGSVAPLRKCLITDTSNRCNLGQCRGILIVYKKGLANTCTYYSIYYLILLTFQQDVGPSRSPYEPIIGNNGQTTLLRLVLLRTVMYSATDATPSWALATPPGSTEVSSYSDKQHSPWSWVWYRIRTLIPESSMPLSPARHVKELSYLVAFTPCTHDSLCDSFDTCIYILVYVLSLILTSLQFNCRVVS